MYKKKSFLIKIYSKNKSTLLKVLTSVKNVPTWVEYINDVPSDTNIILNESFDLIPDYIELNNKVDIYEISGDYPSGKKIYSGLISEIKPNLEGSISQVELVIRNISDPLKNIYFDNPVSGYLGDWVHTYSTPTEIKTIIENVITHYQNCDGNTFVYHDSSIDTTGVSIAYEFDHQKHIEVINTAIQFSNEGWHWFADSLGKITVREANTEADHIFTIGKDVEVISLAKTIETVINLVKVEWSGGTVEYYDSDSIAAYGVRAKFIQDTSIQDEATADKRAIKEVLDSLTPKITGRLRINSKYDLTSINVGDTCKLRNYRKNGSIFEDSMIIVSKPYNWDYAELELGENRSSFMRALSSYLKA